MKDDILTVGKTVGSYEEAIDHMYSFAQRGDTRFNYCFLMKEEDGSLTLVERVSMPCWGAVREYGKGTRPNDAWPLDLRQPRHLYPETGNMIAISFQFHIGYEVELSKEDEVNYNRLFTEFVFNKDVSPWRNLLKDFEIVYKDESVTGVLFKDTNIDPTLLIHMMRVIGMKSTRHSTVPKLWDNNPNIEKGVVFASVFANLYSYIPRIHIDRFINGQPFDLSNGGTLYGRESYNRPEIDKMFIGRDEVFMEAPMVGPNRSIQWWNDLYLNSIKEKKVA